MTAAYMSGWVQTADRESCVNRAISSLLLGVLVLLFACKCAAAQDSVPCIDSLVTKAGIGTHILVTDTNGNSVAGMNRPRLAGDRIM